MTELAFRDSLRRLGVSHQVRIAYVSPRIKLLVDSNGSTGVAYARNWDEALDKVRDLLRQL